MLAALDNTSGDAVLGCDVRDTRQQAEEIAANNRYQCLLCDSVLEYRDDPDDNPFNYFFQVNQNDCVSDGNISIYHRLAQEVVLKTVYNWIPTANVELEKRIGSHRHSSFVIGDVAVTDPVNIAIEVVYTNKKISLQRRLETLFDQGYSVMLIFLTNSPISFERVNHHLGQILSVQVGQFDPRTLDLTFGSLISPGQIDPNNLDRTRVPDYLL